MIELLSRPWPWWLTGLLIGLTVPLLLYSGNKKFGISAVLRHFCTICAPAGIPFFQYEWRKEAWNLFFALGIILGGFVAVTFLGNPNPVEIHPDLARDMAAVGVAPEGAMVPSSLFSLGGLLTLRGFVLMIVGGFLVGFGTRWAGGCTSGHAIMGLSTLQWPSLVATVCFMIGGFIMANLILPFILKL